MVKLAVNNIQFGGIAIGYPAYERDRIMAEKALRMISLELGVQPYKVPNSFALEYRTAKPLTKKDHEYFRRAK